MIKNKRPNILMLIQRFYPLTGGAENQCLLLASNLVQQGYDVAVVTGRHDQSHPLEEVINGVQVYRFPYWLGSFKLLSRVSMVWGAWRYLQSFRSKCAWDVIHVHQIFWLVGLAVSLKNKYHTPVLAKSANSGARSDVEYFYRVLNVFQWPARWLRLRDWVYNRLDRVVCINTEMVNEFINVGVSKEKIILMSNMVELPKYRTHSHQAKQPWRIITTSRLVEQKNPVLHLEVAKTLRKSGQNIQYSLLGDGKLFYVCQNYLAMNGLGTVVKLPGVVPNDRVKKEYLPQAHLYLHLSEAEGMSNSILEAMANGLPCVISAVAGNTDLAGAYDAKLLQKQGYVVAHNAILVSAFHAVPVVVKAIQELFANPNLGARLAQNAYRHLQQTASIPTVVSAYEKVYNQVVYGQEN